MKYNVYEIKIKSGYTHDQHELIFLRTKDTLQEAEEWLKENHEKFTDYTILPSYYFTGLDEQ